jgi:DNA polymerase-4
MPGFCRDCLADLAQDESLCAGCGSNRVLAHPELESLNIAHVDCDAFYAAIEKRDRPSLAGEAVIVAGASARAVVLTACYNARKFGVRSAMPMFQARKLCPHAVVVPPDMRKYATVAKQVRELLTRVTPIIEPVSLDEAYLDLSGTERLHGAGAAKILARLACGVEREIGISVSIGLSHNKFLAKLASDLQKPRGFAVVGRAETRAFLAGRMVGVIRGVGPVLQRTLAKEGITTVGQLQEMSVAELTIRFGKTGAWLHRIAIGEDASSVDHRRETKAISAETTFEHNIASFDELERSLWELSERLAERAKAAALGGRTVTLKLKTGSFRIVSRSTTLENPTQLSGVIFQAGRRLLEAEARGERYRLIGIGLSHLHPATECDPENLLDRAALRNAAAERAMDSLRAKFGSSAIRKGRSLR